MLKSLHEEIKSGKYGKGDNVQQLHDDFNSNRDYRSQSTMGTNSIRNSYMLDEQNYCNENPPPAPLNYIVRLENTFSDTDNVNFLFEYLQGQDLYWVIKNQMAM